MTEKHHLLTNDEFEEKFTNCDIPAVIFTHEAHLRITYIHITKYGIDKAIDNLSTQIANCDDKYGDGTKFNKAYTITTTKVIHSFIEKAKALNFNTFLIEFPRLKTHFSKIVKDYDSAKTLEKKSSKVAHLEANLLVIG